MSPRSLRLLLFLVTVFLVVLAYYLAWVIDSPLAKFIGFLLACTGMITSLMQIFFELPLKFSPRNAERESDLLLPSYYPRKVRRRQVSLILPASYDHSLKIKQRAQRIHPVDIDVFNVVFPLLGVFTVVASIWGMWMIYTHRPAVPCTVLTKQISVMSLGDSYDHKLLYIPDFQVKVKKDQLSGSVKSDVVDARIEGGSYNSQQAAQEQLNHFLLGFTYACYEPIPVGSFYTSTPLGPWDISDKPLSFDGSSG